ncbi:DUF664 domain-containing protein [Acidobacteria bacterium ACD]|nr:MAG: DUF664 domain-containing protein [Acidobacteriota bacterium]MCE7960604.1 DUF664 domain-containing protein [Acidobacteria bacterium ACB2]MDL1951421.1 DUF664 domain-containing protein [Acidobacteria bacterium ACD]
MRLIDPILMEFDRECATTRKMLERIPDEKLEFRPHAKSMTLGHLATHLATIPAWIAASVLDEGFDLAAPMDRPEAPERAAEVVAAFDASVKGAKEALAKLDDALAMGTWTLRKGDLTLMSVPRIAFVRSILLSHSIHHRGQLSVYLRLLDVPLPMVYGPSADENPFA